MASCVLDTSRLVVTPCTGKRSGSVMRGGRSCVVRYRGGRGSRCRRLRERYNGVVEDVYVGVSRRHRRAGLLGSTTSRSQRDRVLGATPPVSGDRRRRDGAPLLLLQQPAQALSQGTAGEGLLRGAAPNNPVKSRPMKQRRQCLVQLNISIQRLVGRRRRRGLTHRRETFLTQF